MDENKQVLAILSPREEHWVGDGFFVSSIFAVSAENARHLSPFLLLDHAAPRQSALCQRRRGAA